MFFSEFTFEMGDTYFCNHEEIEGKWTLEESNGTVLLYFTVFKLKHFWTVKRTK